jgi:hypothetical protein
VRVASAPKEKLPTTVWRASLAGAYLFPTADPLVGRLVLSALCLSPVPQSGRELSDLRSSPAESPRVGAEVPLRTVRRAGTVSPTPPRVPGPPTAGRVDPAERAEPWRSPGRPSSQTSPRPASCPVSSRPSWRSSSGSCPPACQGACPPICLPASSSPSPSRRPCPRASSVQHARVQHVRQPSTDRSGALVHPERRVRSILLSAKGHRVRSASPSLHRVADRSLVRPGSGARRRSGKPEGRLLLGTRHRWRSSESSGARMTTLPVTAPPDLPAVGHRVRSVP